MMLSKTTCYAFIVALCLVISESDGVLEINVVSCYNDDAFLQAAVRFKDINVPILATMNNYLNIDNTIMSYLHSTSYKNIIKVYVDDNKCPETVEFLKTEILNIENKCPALYVMKKDRIVDSVFYPNESTYTQLKGFFDIASRSRTQGYIYVTQRMQWRIDNRNRRLAEDAVKATAVQHSAVTQSYQAAVEGYSWEGQPGYAAGHFMGYSAGDSSRTRSKSHSPSPSLNVPQTLDLFRTSTPRAESWPAEDDPWIGLGTIKYDLKEKRKASPPQNDRLRRRRMSGGDSNKEQTPPQAARSSQEKKEMGKYLKFGTSSPPPPPLR